MTAKAPRALGLRAVRQALGLTQAQFGAQVAGASYRRVCDWERGYLPMPREAVGAVIGYCRSLGIDLTPDHLLGTAPFPESLLSRMPVSTVADPRISPRQREILNQFIAGASYLQIANSMGIAAGTVSAQLTNVSRSLRLTGIRELRRFISNPNNLKKI